jgi:hypothetical protein
MVFAIGCFKGASRPHSHLTHYLHRGSPQIYHMFFSGIDLKVFISSTANIFDGQESLQIYFIIDLSIYRWDILLSMFCFRKMFERLFLDLDVLFLERCLRGCFWISNICFVNCFAKMFYPLEHLFCKLFCKDVLSSRCFVLEIGWEVDSGSRCFVFRKMFERRLECNGSFDKFTKWML